MERIGKMSEKTRKVVAPGERLDFPYVALFRNQSASEAMESKIEATFRNFWPSVKFRGEMEETSEWILRVYLRVKPLTYFW